MPDRELTDAIAERINKTREALDQRSAHNEMALDIMSMKIAGLIAQTDLSFNIANFASLAGVPAHATHLI